MGYGASLYRVRETKWVFRPKRQEQSKYWMFETINEHLRNSFYSDPEIAELLVGLEQEVLQSRKARSLLPGSA